MSNIFEESETVSSKWICPLTETEVSLYDLQPNMKVLVNYNTVEPNKLGYWALARNCNVPLNLNGAKAIDWKKGKPVGVVRTYKVAKHSKYAPKEGMRYDGICKVVEYHPELGKSGHKVWKFLLQHDDPAPAPWTPKGQAH